ncbi:trimeric intracellular cation channel family protein [Pontibacillus litoralis]|uniref:Membrane protein n=1 Tax=Pontibacillus litoralis JSM 072002 TaxID=1385512 RepID=A0A0A5FYX4_9BACI|nr:trimeric intracellular cation channel family protein [Pontibacillus litoralis]KGX84989.1 membrane protein [Pontibacillus litoralis JSM 072002]
MAWDVLNFIAVASFAFSGAVVAISERYDIFGVFILGIATAFAGGIMRNVILQEDVTQVWEQGVFLYVAIAIIVIAYIMPKSWVLFWNKWNVYLDAFGLSAFAIQGALFAIVHELSFGAILFSAVITGVGGGMVRDLLAQKRPMVLHAEIYAVWALLAGVALGIGVIDYTSSWQLYTLFLTIMVFRLLSYHLNWHLRFRDIYRI